MPIVVIDKIEPKNEAFDTIVDAHRVGNCDVDNTELSCLNGILSNVQDQLDAKQISFEIGTGLELTTGEVLAVEQATTNVSLPLGDLGGHEWRPAQSFQLLTAGEATKLMVYFNSANGSPTGVVTLRIETDNAGFPSGTLVDANATITNADCKTEAWFTFTLPANVPLAALTTYWLVLDCDNQSTNVRFNVKASSLNPYASGKWVDKYDGVWQELVGETYDMEFRVYASSNNLHTLDSEIVHDSLSGGGGNRHIDHTAVSVIAGTGLTGGGTIAADRTLALSHLGIQSLTSPGADRIMFWDQSVAAMGWLNASTGLSIAGTALSCTITQYTDALARAALSSSATGLTYTSATGVFSLSAGYEIPTTVALAAKVTNPMTTLGDLIAAAADGVPGRLGIGSEAQVLTVSSGAPAWVNAASGFANPMTTPGDLILGGVGGAAGRLGIGADTYVLTSNGTTAAWAAPTGGAGGSSAREIINSILSAWRCLDTATTAYQLLCDGMVDAFNDETGVDVATSTNETYTAATDDYRNSSGGATLYSVTGTAYGDAFGDIGGVEQRLAQGFTPAADVGVASMTIAFVAKSGSPTGQVTLRIETDNAGSPSGTLVHANATKAITPTASADNTFTFPATIALSSGVLYWFVMTCDAQANNVYWGIDESSASEYAGGGRAVSADGGATWGAASSTIDIKGYITQGGYNIMTLQSNAFTAKTQPDTAYLVLLEAAIAGSPVLNTDIIGKVSRDGGTTWTTITLADRGNYVSGKKILYGTADISGQPAGTSMKWRVVTTADYQSAYYGVGLLWE